MSRLVADAIPARSGSVPQIQAVDQGHRPALLNPPSTTAVGLGGDTLGGGSSKANPGGYTLIDVYGVAEKLGVSRATVYREVKKESLPDAVRIGERSVRWISEELDAWVGANCPPAAIWRKVRHRFGFGIPGAAA